MTEEFELEDLIMALETDEDADEVAGLDADTEDADDLEDEDAVAGVAEDEEEAL